MFNLQTLILIAVLLLICVCVTVAWAIQRRDLIRVQAAQEQLQQQMLSQLNHIQKQHKKSQSLYSQTDLVQKQSLDDVNQSIQALTHRLDAVEDKQQELAAFDPDVKLYQQAKRMVAAGASLEEVVETCGIPKAEAELLFSMVDSHPS